MDRIETSLPTAQLRVILAYDIVDDNRRIRAAETALDFVPRSQLSVFDGWLPPERPAKLWEAVHDVLKMSEDSAFLFVLCKACASCAGGLGAAPSPDRPGTGWIV